MFFLPIIGNILGAPGDKSSYENYRFPWKNGLLQQEKKKNTIALEVHSWIGKKKWHLFYKSHYLSQVLSLGGAWLIISECLELSVFLVLSLLHMFTVTPTFSFILAWISELFRSRSGFWMQKPSNDQILITSTKQIWTISSEQWKPLHR